MDNSSFIQFDVPEHSSTVLSQLNELRLQGKLCDIIVHIQGQPFRAHKAVLAASFLQMQCVIDKCTQILESIHSKISVGDVDSVTIGAEENPESRNGVKDGSFFTNPVEISPPYCPQVRQPPVSSDLRMETTPNKALRSRLQEEGHSDRGSSGSVSEYEIQIEGDHEQGDLLVRESQITEVKVKMEKSDRPSCSDSSSLGDDGYHTEMVDGEQVVAVNVGAYGSVLQHAYPYSQTASQPSSVPEAFGGQTNSSPSRSMLSCFRGRGARQKRALSVHLHSDLQGVVQGSDSEAMMNNPGYESSPRERSARGYWYPYNERLICIYCGKSFNQKGSLDRHMRLHMGITPFVCKFCGKCFPFQGTLNQHLRKNHPGVTEGRGRMESPERTDMYVEQKLESDASASEMALDSRLEMHTVSDAPD